jgi:type II secretory pathway predicted ATPase ExeA
MNKIRHVVDYGQSLTSIMGDVGLGKFTLVRFLMDEFTERDDLRWFNKSGEKTV